MNKEIFDKMIEVYKPNGLDWMGTPITVNNPLTVQRVCDGELSCVALLTKNSVRKLQMLRPKNVELFNEWVWLFYAIYVSESCPSTPYTEMQQDLREQTNNEIYGINMNLKRSF